MGDFKLAETAFTTWLVENPTGSRAIASLHALNAVIHNNEFTAGSECISSLKATITHLSGLYKNWMSVDVAMNIFFRYVSRVDWTLPKDALNQEVRARASTFVASVQECRKLIYESIESFIRDDQTILVHGNSNVVTNVLINAAKKGKTFTVICTESRPSCDGYTCATNLSKAGIPVKICTDTAVASLLPHVTMVLCGAETVDQKGSIINPAGTTQLALCCKAVGKPFYVLCESFKFMRQMIFNQDDLTKLIPAAPPLELCQHVDAEHIKHIEQIAPRWDYTESDYVTLFFTDLGVLPPSAVSDQLFKLYY